MEYMILGLLAQREMNVHEIINGLERNLSLIYNTSFGSINTTISRMLAKGWISGQEKVNYGRNKKTFHLTPAGWEAFQDWLNSDIEVERIKDPGQTRLYFMGFAHAQARINVLETHLEKLRRKRDAMELILQQTVEIETMPDLEDTHRFQLFTLDYTRSFYIFNITWYQNLLESLKNGIT
jgi:DNA-binding PadR family transcriptional regulator